MEQLPIIDVRLTKYVFRKCRSNLRPIPHARNARNALKTTSALSITIETAATFSHDYHQQSHCCTRDSHPLVHWCAFAIKHRSGRGRSGMGYSHPPRG